VISKKTSSAAVVTVYDVSVSDLRKSKRVEVSEQSGKVGVCESEGSIFCKCSNDRSMYHGRQHLGEASVNETTCKTVILLTFSITTIVVILLMVFADIFAVAIMGIVSVTNSRYVRRTLY